MSEYAKVFMKNMPKSARVAFVLLPHYNPLYTWMYGYLFQCFYETRSYSLKEYEAVFFKRQNLIFLIAGESIWFACCFRRNVLQDFQLH